MKLNLPMKDWIGYAAMIATITASYVLTNTNQDKNNALMNQKLDTVIMSQQSITTDVNNIKIALNNHEVRITVIEKTSIPLLSAAQLDK